MIMRTRAAGCLVAAAGAVMLLAGCATSGSAGAAASSPEDSESVSVSVSVSGTGSVVAVPDWPALQAAVAQADAQLDTAKGQGWWSGPVCNPDIELHRENAGQDPLADEELRAECARNLAEFRASRDDFAALQALDAAARTAELARVGTLLGLPAGQDPTVGQVVVVHGCEQGWITDPADCVGIPAG